MLDLSSCNYTVLLRIFFFLVSTFIISILIKYKSRNPNKNNQKYNICAHANGRKIRRQTS